MTTERARDTLLADLLRCERPGTNTITVPEPLDEPFPWESDELFPSAAFDVKLRVFHKVEMAYREYLDDISGGKRRKTPHITKRWFIYREG